LQIITLKNPSLAPKTLTQLLFSGPTNIGYGRAANIALAKVKTPYAMLLNPDLHATPELIEKLLVHAQNASQAAIIAPTVKTKDLDRVQSGSVRWVSGAAMLFNMALMKNVGWFDENIFLFSEETDLCRRTRTAGYDILRIQDIYMQHLKGKSSLPNPQVEYMKNWHVGWSHAYYCTKHNLAIGKSHPARSIVQYRIKACFAFDPIKRTKYTARADGISAFMGGEKAFLPDGTPQASPSIQKQKSQRKP